MKNESSVKSSKTTNYYPKYFVSEPRAQFFCDKSFVVNQGSKDHQILKTSSSWTDGWDLWQINKLLQQYWFLRSSNQNINMSCSVFGLFSWTIIWTLTGTVFRKPKWTESVLITGANWIFLSHNEKVLSQSFIKLRINRFICRVSADICTISATKSLPNFHFNYFGWKWNHCLSLWYY